MTMTKQDYLKWAKDCLEAADAPRIIVERYTPLLAIELERTAESFLDDDLPWLEKERDGAAEDAYWQRKLDEARGK